MNHNNYLVVLEEILKAQRHVDRGQLGEQDLGGLSPQHLVNNILENSFFGPLPLDELPSVIPLMYRFFFISIRTRHGPTGAPNLSSCGLLQVVAKIWKFYLI